MFDRLWWASAAAPAMVLVMSIGSSAGAQALGGSPTTFDASIAPRGVVRLQALTAWTRVDQVYGLSTDGSTRPLGSLFSTDSLGAAQLPALALNESSLRALAGDANAHLSLGRLVTSADSRVADTPIELQYGVTSRLAISVMVPLVMSRTTVIQSMNGRCRFETCAPNGRLGNVGVNPARYAQTVALQNQLAAAVNALQLALQNCQSNPGAAGCQNLLAHAADAQQLNLTTAAFVTNLGAVYGTGTSQTGQPFVPLAGSTLEARIQGELLSFASQYQALLPAGQQVTIDNTLPDAAGPIGMTQYRQLVGSASGIGFDSIATVKRIGVGDMEFGVAYRVFDQLSDSAHASGIRARAAVQGIVRLGTGAPPDATYPYDLGTGEGQTDVEGRAAVDVRAGARLGATVSGLYTYAVTNATLARVPIAGGGFFPLQSPMSGTWKPGNVYALSFAPRVFATRYFQLTGRYDVRHVTADLVTPMATAADTTTGTVATVVPPYISRPASTEQRLGFGFTYSSLESYARGASPLPLEISWLHQQTIHATGGVVPQYFRDQVQFRLYYPLVHSTH